MVAAGQHGTLETITLERNPATITELQQRENSPVRRLVATPIA